MDLLAEESFKSRVIKITQSIPRGFVTTYGTIAVLAGIPRGARMVGGILHYAIDKWDLPWHRVVNRVGFISTKCLEHPRQLQKALLEEEGIVVDDQLTVDLDRFGWFGEQWKKDSIKKL